jgi:hypothetical protein
MDGFINTLKMEMDTIQILLNEYLKTLSEKELQGYEIAKSHLGDSFDLSKSLGFIQWKNEQTKS